MATTREAAAGRVRVLGGFAAFGAFWGSWGAALPAVQSHAGVAVAGGGISICAPILFSIAGRGADEDVRGAAVSIVTTIAYLGFLVGPAVVGLLANATTLSASLAAVAVVALGLALLSPAAGRGGRGLRGFGRGSSAGRRARDRPGV